MSKFVKNEDRQSGWGASIHALTTILAASVPYQLLGALALPCFPCEASAEAKANRGHHEDSQVRCHQPSGVKDVLHVLQVQPVKDRENRVGSGDRDVPKPSFRNPKGGSQGVRREWGSYLVTPICRDTFSQRLPAEKRLEEGGSRPGRIPSGCSSESWGPCRHGY